MNTEKQARNSCVAFCPFCAPSFLYCKTHETRRPNSMLLGVLFSPSSKLAQMTSVNFYSASPEYKYQRHVLDLSVKSAIRNTISFEPLESKCGMALQTVRKWKMDDELASEGKNQFLLALTKTMKMHIFWLNLDVLSCVIFSDCFTPYRPYRRQVPENIFRLQVRSHQKLGTCS